MTDKEYEELRDIALNYYYSTKNSNFNKEREGYKAALKLTEFLPHHYSLKLRIQNIESRAKSIMICPICNLRPLKITETRGYSKTCGHNECVQKTRKISSLEIINEVNKGTNSMHVKEFVEKLSNSIKSKTPERFKNILIKDGYEEEIEYVKPIGSKNKAFYHELKCKKCNEIFSISSSTYKLRHNKGQNICSNCNPLHKNYSCGEKEVLEYVKLIYKGIILENTKSIIYPYEFDIYLPDLLLAIEYNGNHVHANPSLDRYKNFPEKMINLGNCKDKTKIITNRLCKEIWKRDEIKKSICDEKGIDLIVIWENDWDKKRKSCEELIKNKIKSLLIGKSYNKLINCRKTLEKHFVDNKIEYEIFDKHSLKIDDFIIRFYGVDYHKVDNVGRNYLSFEKQNFEKQNLKMIQVWDDQYNNSQNLYNNVITKIIGKKKNTIIGARKCKMVNLKDLSKQKIKDFINEYHLQGFIGYTHGFGLTYNDELLFITTFKIKSIIKDNWEIGRVCTKDGFVVYGGLSKLWSHFLKEINPKNCITYCDRSLFFGNAYRNLIGMKELKITEPNYWYCNGNCRINRYAVQKQKLINKYPEYKDKTEIFIMKNILGYEMIENAGNYKFEYNRTTFM